MSGSGKGLRWLGTLLIAIAGCYTTQAQFKPTRPPEEYTLPPDDPRFSNAMSYPKEVMNADRIKQEKKAEEANAKAAGGGLRGGSGGGMPQMGGQ